jgi:hypothetical protein
VLRPALARVDDRTLVGATGYIHDYADRRLPVPGAIGLAATVSGTAVAALAGHPGAATARDGRIPADARVLQRQRDHVINARAVLQTAAVAALCAALILS